MGTKPSTAARASSKLSNAEVLVWAWGSMEEQALTNKTSATKPRRFFTMYLPSNSPLP
jgi:hypothetical protein